MAYWTITTARFGLHVPAQVCFLSPLLLSLSAPLTVHSPSLSSTRAQYGSRPPNGRGVSLAYICPLTQPEYHKAMQDIPSTTSESFESRVSLACDYTFQHMLDHDGYLHVTFVKGEDFQESLEIDNMNHPVTHRIVADTKSGGAWLGTSGHDYDLIVLSYERIEREENHRILCQTFAMKVQRTAESHSDGLISDSKTRSV